MALAPDEIERYARHLVLAEVGGPGQARIKAARILVVGAGGLGAPLIQYLAAAGIDVILYERGERAGVMFGDGELVGVPHGLVTGERGLKD
ncbi:ThiF family adenylyltransferase, partial [Citrobacter sp. VF227]